MAPLFFKLQTTTIFSLFVASLCFIPNANSQGNTIGGCTSSALIPLMPCGPFVEGSDPSPDSSCCDNLKLLSTEQFECLCLMLNDHSLSSLPINRTLAFELPALCNLGNAMPTCSGMPAPLAPISPASQVSFGARNNGTVAASPFHAAPPKVNLTSGESHVSGSNSNAVNHLAVALLAETILIGATCTFNSWSIMFLNV